MTTLFPRSPASWLAALLLLLLAIGSNSTAHAADGSSGTSESLKFGLGPARAVPQGQTVDGRAYLNYSASPGATLFDQVALINYSSEPLVLELYATDAVQAEDGGFGLLPGAEKPTDAGSWIKLDVPKNGKVTVPARVGDDYGRLAVALTASIPANATPGDHVGGVVASLKSTSTNSQGAQVTLDQRIGLRTYFSLSGQLKPELKIENLKATYDYDRDPLGRGRIQVSYTVHNTGNMRLDADQDVSVGRWLIRGIVGDPAPIEDILPGGRIDVTETFPNRFGLGPLTAQVTLHPSAVDPLYAQTIPDVTATQRFWAWPWVLIAIIVGILLLLFGLYRWRRHRRHRRQRRASDSGAVASPARAMATPFVAISRRGSRWVRRPMRAGLAVVLIGVGPLLIGMPSAEATPPVGSRGEVIVETDDATGVPANALIQGRWGHEGTKNGSLGTSFISMNAADETGAVTDASVAALHQALGDGGSFDALRVAFVPYSADGSNERPKVTRGESVADAFTWFADLGMGSALSGNANPNDSVAIVSTGAEYKAWWDAGRPLQGFTDDLGMIDIASDNSTRPASAPQGRSILDRWPAGQKISMVLYLSDGTDPQRPGLPTVAVGPDGRAMASWLTLRTVADPSDPTRSSAGYRVLTGAGTGPDAPVPSSGATPTGGAAPTDPVGAGGSDGASPSAAPAGQDGAAGAGNDGGVASRGDEPAAVEPAGGIGAGEAGQAGGGKSESAAFSAIPGGAPAFVLLLALVVIGLAAGVRWLRSGRSDAMTGTGS